MTNSQRIENELGRLDSYYGLMRASSNDLNDMVEQSYTPATTAKVHYKMHEALSKVHNTLLEIEDILDEEE